MKNTALLCLASAAVGAVVSVAFTTQPKADQVMLAQGTPTDAAPGGYPPSRGLIDSTALPGVPASHPGAGLATDEDELTPEERVNIAVYEDVNRSVVHITTKSYGGDGLFWRETASNGDGSGSVLDQQGHILTNYHVVEGAREIRVTLFDGKSYDARPVGVDRATDVVVLKIDAPTETLHPVVLGDSARLRVGQRVFAIGNPFGLDRTLSTGIVSSLNRTLPSQSKYRTMEQIIQIDASINPGNSGGPLLDTRGRMIGMNTAIASTTGESAGVGFAIPVSTIARIIPQLIESGRVVRADIGIGGVYELEQGLLIVTLVPGGAAEKAGLEGPKLFRRRGDPFTYVDRSAADLITAVDGKPVRTVAGFLSIVESKQPGERVMVSVTRDGSRVDVPVVLEATD